MADTINKPKKKPASIKKITRPRKPISKPSILSVHNLDNDKDSLKLQDKDFSRVEDDEEENNQFSDLFSKSPDELMQLASELDLSPTKFPRKIDLIISLMSVIAEKSGVLIGAGALDVLHDGFGFLRNPEGGDKNEDIYVSQTQIRRFGLRKGDFVAGQVRPPKDNEKYYGLIRVEMVNGGGPDSSKQRGKFEKFTSIYPNERLVLETGVKPFSTRLIDILSPIGKGQRALIVAPPKAGKTVLLKEIASGISNNYPEIVLLVALIGERPEEVTDMRRSINGEVYSSTFDEPVEDHCRMAELALNRAYLLVESGQDVVILLDSLTRLARAYNLKIPSSGRTLSGGMDPLALYPPKHFFGAARNCEEGGSLTIIASCLVDTGSRLDDLIYEEFKGTGNMELHLDRKLAEQRVFPSIEMTKSGTRHEELLLDDYILQQSTLLRRMMALSNSHSSNSHSDAASDPSDFTKRILREMGKTESNEEFLKFDFMKKKNGY